MNALTSYLKRLDGRIARWLGWDVPLDENGHIRHRRGTRDVVETAIDLSKANKRRTWGKAVRDPGAGGGK